MGYSRKIPHLPDGWQTGNPGRRGWGMGSRGCGNSGGRELAEVNFLGFAELKLQEKKGPCGMWIFFWNNQMEQRAA